VRDITQRRHRTTAAIAIHDAGIQAQHAVTIGIAAAPDRGIAQITLGPARTGFHGIERRTTGRQRFPGDLVGPYAEIPGGHHPRTGGGTRLQRRQCEGASGQGTGLEKSPAVSHG